jgi:hypothetical protein
LPIKSNAASAVLDAIGLLSKSRDLRIIRGRRMSSRLARSEITCVCDGPAIVMHFDVTASSHSDCVSHVAYWPKADITRSNLMGILGPFGVLV